MKNFSTIENTIHTIREECIFQGLILNTQIAYILATTEWETARTFKPVKEGCYLGEEKGDKFREKLHYAPYWGRGFVQITWEDNYKKYSKLLNIDLVNQPDLALENEIALFILIDGFKYGRFTGKKITDYINKSKTDFYHARKCINRLDKAEEIAKIAEKYLKWLNELDTPTREV